MKYFLLLLGLTAGSVMAQNPAITEILNNYGLINNGTVAQGAIFIVKGSNLADVQTETLQNVPLQRNLQGVEIRITVNGVTTTAPLYYALNFQLACILPSNTPEGVGTLVVVNNGKTSTPANITVVKSAFGMLTVNGGGTGLAAVHDVTYSLLSNTNATRPGQNVTFYGSGLGPVTLDETNLQVARDMTEIPITVTIGGVNATVLYRGRTIYPGLDQINVTIPTLQSYSCDVPVLITTNGVQANAGTIPVTQEGATCQPSGGNNGGGNNSGITGTQEEINRWISQGFYTVGGIGTTRATNYSINQAGITTTEKDDTLSATFYRFSGADLPRYLRNEFPAEYAQFVPQVGSCVVYSITAPIPFPQITSVSLDAGPQITASGPNGSLVAPRQVFEGNISYYNENPPANFIVPGNYTFTGTGGPGAGAFTGSLNIQTEFVVTNNPNDFLTINRNQPLTVRWTGGDPTTTVQITGSSSQLDGMTPGAFKYFACAANNSAGQFTVPADILTQLPPSGRIDVPGFPIVFRGSFGVSTSNRGNRITIPNIDLGYAAHTWSWAYTPEYK